MDPIIDIFQPEHADAFAALNRAWLVAYDLLEPPDEDQLNDPWSQILDVGGQIFVAMHDSEVVGTCAVVPHGEDAFELMKLAVSPSAQGRGIGRRLVDTSLSYVRQRGGHRATLLSNSRLKSALRLYEQLGFRYCPVPPEQPYASADVYMELDLTFDGVTANSFGNNDHPL